MNPTDWTATSECLPKVAVWVLGWWGRDPAADCEYRLAYSACQLASQNDWLNDEPTWVADIDFRTGDLDLLEDPPDYWLAIHPPAREAGDFSSEIDPTCNLTEGI